MADTFLCSDWKFREKWHITNKLRPRVLTYFLAYYSTFGSNFQQICPVNAHQLQIEKKVLLIPVAKKGCVSSIILFRTVNKKSTFPVRRSLATAKQFSIILLGNFTPSCLQAWTYKVLKTLKVGVLEENLSLFGKTICITKSSISFFFFSVRNRLSCRFPSWKLF